MWKMVERRTSGMGKGNPIQGAHKVRQTTEKRPEKNEKSEKKSSYPDKWSHWLSTTPA